MNQPSVVVLPQVLDALRRGEPVVALESAVITTGLPRQPFAPPRDAVIEGWDAGTPANLALARLLIDVVRAGGAVPAMIAVLDGTLHIGLTNQQIERLATDASAGKCSTTDLAHALMSGRTAGTTVAATLAACAPPILDISDCIRVFATGGIGGVHRNWQQAPDVSADLRAIASTPTCIVCAGAKSILDLPATLASLEALGVPVVGWRSDWFAQFYVRGDGTLPLSQRVDSIDDAAMLCSHHWRTLERRTGIVLSNPVLDAFALDPAEAERALAGALDRASRSGIAGAALTPLLLQDMARATVGRTLTANIALLRSNAALAAELAVALAGMK